MSFFKFEINTVEEAKIAKAMLDTYIKLSETSNNNDKMVNKPIEKNKDIKPTVKGKVVNKPKKEVIEVDVIEDINDLEKDNIEFVDIQNLCRDIVSKCSNNVIEREYRKSISHIALKYGTGRGIRDIEKSNYSKAYNDIKELLNELEEIPY
jgi:hypothetical protein